MTGAARSLNPETLFDCTPVETLAPASPMTADDIAASSTVFAIATDSATASCASRCNASPDPPCPAPETDRSRPIDRRAWPLAGRPCPRDAVPGVRGPSAWTPCVAPLSAVPSGTTTSPLPGTSGVTSRIEASDSGQRAHAASNSVVLAASRQRIARCARAAHSLPTCLTPRRPAPRDQSSISRSKATPPSCGVATTFW